ncbi:hypothetical protein DJ68_12935 [Halorubrum sp. C3]|nr:hypothetical protein DJ68_12935 [Halorubrum sp. C3]
MIGEKTIVVGLDGAHFELIEPWIEAGELPNIERAIDNGVTAHSQSVLPPVTSPNWKAYATGKNPGKLGIFWWENVDMADERVYYPDERKSTNTEYWELIGEQSSACVVNVPTTYPPRTSAAMVVAGAPDGADSGYTQPPELEAELRDELGYRVTKETPITSQPDAAAAEIIDLIDLRFRAGKYLLNQYDPNFLQITTFYLNSLHHFFWDDEQTLRGWTVVDDHLGEFLDAGYNVVLMSDHGATEIETVFHINAWLEREGYLISDMGMIKALSSAGITAERLIDVTSRLGVRRLAKRVTPRWILDRIPTKGGEVSRERKTVNINWNKTTALASGQGPVYIDSEIADYESVRSSLIEELSSLTGPDGKPIATAVHRGEDVYDGPYLDEAPDIVVEQRNGIHIQGGLGRSEVFTKPEADGWYGENKRDGLFVGAGPDFTTGSIEEFSILDLAPTLLHLHGCAVPADMDGTVRTAAFSEDSDTLERAVERIERDLHEDGSESQNTEDNEVRSRLQDLGYLE